MHANVATPKRTNDIITKYGFTFKKSLGQNFLIDQNILQQYRSAAELDETKGALEIGPGIGALDAASGQAAGRVTAVEIDHRLIPDSAGRALWIRRMFTLSMAMCSSSI